MLCAVAICKKRTRKSQNKKINTDHTLAYTTKKTKGVFMQNSEKMAFWTVQPRKVLEVLKQQHAYVPTLSAGIRKFPLQTQADTEYITQYKSLIEYAVFCLYYRNGLLELDGSFTEHGNEIIPALCTMAAGTVTQESINDLAPVFGFAASMQDPNDSTAQVFKEMNFEEFRDFLAKHLFAIDSLWKGFAKDSVILKVTMPPGDYCAIDINSWQFLMPPTIIMPPFSEDDLQSLRESMMRKNVIIGGPLPSEIYQVTLPYIAEKDIVETHDMIDYQTLKSISETKYPNAQMEIFQKQIFKEQN